MRDYIMSTIQENITTETRSSRAPRTPKTVKRETNEVSFVASVKNYFTKHKLAKQWQYRNLAKGDIFVETLEVESIVFQQNLFIESSKAISEKLTRLGFIEQTVFPDCEQYQTFCTTFYNARHNLAVSLYPAKFHDALATAYKISTKTTQDAASGLAIFLNTVNVVTESK